MKFVQTEYELFPGSKIVRFACGEFEVSASRHGVVMKGVLSIATNEHLETLAYHIALAWKHHGRMKDEKME
jgi:hypothetical protein